MKLTGIMEDVFRGVTIFRGFATLKTLARLSSFTDYQRKHEEKRIIDILEYMKNSQFVFFPELILGWQINSANAIRKIKEVSTRSIFIEDNIKIKKEKFRFTSSSDKEEPRIKVVTIEVPNIINKTIFSRIDGNHRLVVIDKIIQDKTEETNENICNQIAPFCLIIQGKNIESEKYESAYFYLINSKSKPLTTNENLKAILKNEKFSPLEKQSLLSLNNSQILYVEHLEKYISASSIDFIKEILENENYTFIINLIRNVIKPNDVFEEEKAKNLINAIKCINGCYLTKKISQPTFDILLGLTIQYFQEANSFEKFLDWINKNEVGAIHELPFKSIIELFVNIHKQKTFKVFVAMPYISHKRVNDYNTLFKEVLLEISKNIGFGLELIPIMRFRGESQRIDQRLIQKIKECDIFIGDLTTVNNNVIFEIGLAEGNNKKILLIKANEDTCKLPFDKATTSDKGKYVPFDMDKLQYIPYSNSGYYNDIKMIMRNNIPKIVNQLNR